jgi:hypothetical protein
MHMGRARALNARETGSQAQAMMGAGAAVDDVLEKLRRWLDRMLSPLERIAGQLSGATSFSISVSTNVSVTVKFSTS